MNDNINYFLLIQYPPSIFVNTPFELIIIFIILVLVQTISEEESKFRAHLYKNTSFFNKQMREKLNH